MKNDKVASGAQARSAVRGWFRAHEQLISGWIRDEADLQRQLDVELIVDGRTIGIARADRYDRAVQSQFGGDGKHAFAFYYANPPSAWTEGHVLAREKFEGVELRTKGSRVTKSSGTSHEFVLEKANAVQIVGRAGGYPPLNNATLEFWRDDSRVLSDIPLTWEDKVKRRFAAHLNQEAIQCLLAGPVEVTLPGLKEAGVSVPLALDLKAIVNCSANELSVELSGEYDDSDTVELTIELATEGVVSKHVRLIARGGRASCEWPAEIAYGAASVQVLVCGTPIPTTFDRQLELQDPNFALLSSADHDTWQLSKDCLGECGFYAFPSELTSQLGLSGHFAHLWRDSIGSVIRVSQPVLDRLAVHDKIHRQAVLRARKGLKLSLRLADDAGVLAEATCVARGEQRWVPLHLAAVISRPIKGRARFEIEADGEEVDELDVALGHSATAKRTLDRPENSNLLVNDKLTHWPHGAGVMRHTVRGEICQGWRLYNRKCNTPVLSRAVMDLDDGSIGLAVAAPKISDHLRLEADLAGGEVAHQSTILSFRAGISRAARQLLSQSTEPTPDLILLNRLYLLRRTRRLTDHGLIVKDEIASVAARNIPISWNMERHSYVLPAAWLPEPEDDDEDPHSLQLNPPQKSYHLIFEFRQPTVIAVHDIELHPAVEGAQSDQQQEQLQLEDRNIRLQVPLLKSIDHWISSSPVAPSAKPSTSLVPLKWSSDISREVVEIVIPVHNALEETIGCLESLSRTTTVPILVRLIDDGSDAHVLEALEAYAFDRPWIRVQSLGRNHGYTYAADFGIRNAQSNWVVLLNSDTVVTNGWLEGLLECARSDPRNAFVGPLSNAATYQSIPHVHDAAGKFKVNTLPSGITPDDMAELLRRVSLKDYPEVPLLNGFCTLMKRSVFLEVGGLNCAAFPTGYGEENDLCIRVRKSGGRLAVADDVYVFHHKSASFGSERRAELSKKGSAALRKLHPEVDTSALTSWFKEIPALVAVRRGVARELGQLLGDAIFSQDSSANISQSIAA